MNATPESPETIVKAGCALKRPRMRLLSGRVDAVTRDEALAVAEQLLATQKPHHIVTANTLLFLAFDSDPSLRTLVDSASFVVPESSGLFWASKKLGTPLPDFIPGIDYMAMLCQLAAKQSLPIFLIGAKPGIAARAGAVLGERFPGLKIGGIQDGYFQEADETALFERVKASGSRFVFVGLNMPRQEKWISKNLAQFGPALVMGVGGSFDVFSGNLKRAPGWMRRFGIEWLYRLYQEPWRYGRIAELPRFVIKVYQAKWSRP